MTKKIKQLEDRWANTELRYHKVALVQVGTHKSAIVMWVPGMESALWMTARDAENLAAVLLQIAKHRRALTAQDKKR